MNHFDRRDGALYAEDVPIAAIAEAVGTPFYVYATATIERHYRVFAEAFADREATVLYSLKANGNLAVVRTLARLGAGADVVSGGELYRALAAGVPPERIVFSGVGKTDDEMAFGVKTGILQFNVESLDEIAALDAVARRCGKRASVALRVNPDVDARTHDKIATGRRGDKFGIDADRAAEAAARVARADALDLVGLAVHIGSQLVALDPFEAAFRRLVALANELRAAGHDIRRLDLGGGLGIRYGDDDAPPLPMSYAEMVKRATAGFDGALLFEPGRVIVGNAGLLIARVVRVKTAGERRYVIVDAGMNDLLRPTLYGARHAIEPVVAAPEGAVCAPADVVGPICETGDTFATGTPLPPLAPGALLAFRSAGAYGAVMASTYNARPLVPEVLVRGDRFAVVRRRPDYDEMLALERLPDWLADDAAAARARGVA